MYKKITHKILEEQFDQSPTMETSNSSTDTKLTINDFVLANGFRRKLRELFFHFNNRVRDYMLAVTNNSADKIEMQNQVRVEIQNIGDYLGRFLTPEETAEAVAALTTTINSVMAIIQSIKNGEDTTAQEEQNINNITSMALIPTFRSTSYLFTRVTTLWFAATVARVAENWADDITAITTAEATLVAGNEYLISVVDVIANDILSRFPSKF